MGKFQVENCEIEGLKVITPTVFGDERGYFMETYQYEDFKAAGIDVTFVQDNQSASKKGVLRGLHFQIGKYAQSKLLRVVTGRVLDVVVDIRKGSPTFGKSVIVELSEEDHRLFFVPRGFAHGFAVLSKEAIFQYKCDNFYTPSAEGAIAWNDPALGIDWQIPAEKVILSEKDKHHPLLADAPWLFDYNEDLY